MHAHCSFHWRGTEWLILLVGLFHRCQSNSRSGRRIKWKTPKESHSDNRVTERDSCVFVKECVEYRDKIGVCNFKCVTNYNPLCWWNTLYIYMLIHSYSMPYSLEFVSHCSIRTWKYAIQLELRIHIDQNDQRKMKSIPLIFNYRKWGNSYRTFGTTKH